MLGKPRPSVGRQVSGRRTAVSKVLVLILVAAFIVVLNIVYLAFAIGSHTDIPGPTISTHMEKGKRIQYLTRAHGSSIPPMPQHTSDQNPTTTIIVLIAAFRDGLCGNTVHEAFRQAAFPDRITVGIVQQNDKGDLDCIEEYCKKDPNCRRDQVRVMPVPLDHSRGVMPARYRQELLIEDETFCMQIDSHMVFSDYWDLLALDDWLLTDNEMAVLTTYPNRVKDRLNQELSPIRCKTRFSGDGLYVYGGNSADNRPTSDRPYLAPFFGAGISFSKCHAHLNVPYDPYMSFLFGGEEFNRASRLFTWGYDMYAPRRNYAYHYYDSDIKLFHAGPSRVRNFEAATSSKNRQLLSKEGVKRWRAVYGLDFAYDSDKPPTQSTMENFPFFGVGAQRSMKVYEDFSGVNLETHTMVDKCPLVGKMDYQSYQYEDKFLFGELGGNPCSTTDASGRCCYTLDIVRESVNDMLAKENNALGDITGQSDTWKPSVTGPVISPVSSGQSISITPARCHGPFKTQLPS